MANLYDEFIEAINSKKLVTVNAYTESKGTITRKCVPFDFGPSRRYKDGLDRYHFWDIDSPDGSHNLSILPDNLLSLVILKVDFNPGDYVTWTPKWYISRDWGLYS
jgi:hypothetical protein